MDSAGAWSNPGHPPEPALSTSRKLHRHDTDRQTDTQETTGCLAIPPTQTPPVSGPGPCCPSCPRHELSHLPHHPPRRGSSPPPGPTACLIAVHCTPRLPSWLSGKGPVCQHRRHKRRRFSPWVGKVPWRSAWQPTPVFWPGESHGQRSLCIHKVAKSRTWLSD